jgi:hypothetical protein
MEKRFEKALFRLFPGRVFRIYADKASLRRALSEAGMPQPEDKPFPDPAFPRSRDKTGAEASTEAAGVLSLWRPFLPGEVEKEAEKAPVMIPVLPWPLAPQVLAIRQDLEHLFLPGDLVSPILLAASARSVYDLIASAPDRGRGRYQKINKALSEQGCHWRRRGIYLTCDSCINRDAWAELWRRFLEAGFLLPPSQQEPLILPGLMSPGEEAKLAVLLA